AARGLPNAPTTRDAIRSMTRDENIALFEKYRIFNRRELESRFEVSLEDYRRKIRIEGEIAAEIASTMLLPAVRDEYGKCLHALESARVTGIRAGNRSLQKRAELFGDGCDELAESSARLREALDGSTETILDAMRRLRDVADRLERETPDEMWPLPKYREMLFIY
ncbi:MAG: hypothetical protein MJ016_07220, partial [Victivallaceae bacterium]|nr:hypothetical protein [Victivallaceae bacterium]